MIKKNKEVKAHKIINNNWLFSKNLVEYSIGNKTIFVEVNYYNEKSSNGYWGIAEISKSLLYVFDMIL